MSSDVLTFILAGGEGLRLRPLTETRCKPAVLFGGRYRLIDVAISNAKNAGFSDVYLLSQFLSESLNHYIDNTYAKNVLENIHIETLSPKDTDFQGTADAIRQHLDICEKSSCEYVVILSGDQLYSMDLQAMLAHAKEKNADLTVATLCVNEEEASRMGVMQMDSSHLITKFVEKPTDTEERRKLAIAPHIAEKYNAMDDLSFLGSMGIYIFKKDYLISLLRNTQYHDFGKDIIPREIHKKNTYAYIFDGYWEDIGTINSYYHANLKLAKNEECLDLYNQNMPIYTQMSALPSARVNQTKIFQGILCEGSIIDADTIFRSMIGVRSSIGKGSKIIDSIIMGWSPDSKKDPIQVGENCFIEKTIIDEGARIGNYVKLTVPPGGTLEYRDDMVVRDGILVVKSGAHIPDHFSVI